MQHCRLANTAIVSPVDSVVRSMKVLHLRDLLLLSSLAVSCQAADRIAFASHFHGGAVLQRGAPVAIWGNSTGAAGSRVVVTLVPESGGGSAPAARAEAVVNADGTWRTHLPPQPAAWRRELVASTATATATARLDVRIGEVVICSGQSNMQMPVNHWQPGGFSASNGTEEAAAAGRYAGKISLMSLQTPFPRPTRPPWNGSACGMPNAPNYPADCVPYPQWQTVSPGPNGTLHGFSALCWYTGKSLFEEQLNAQVPVGLIAASVGGSAIELWLPPGRVNASAASGACGVDDPPCDVMHNLTDSLFFNAHVAPLRPYTIGAMVWDQGERDVHCFPPAAPHTARYPCMQRALVESWRSAVDGFNSSFAFAAVQLPGYMGDCDGNGQVPFSPNCVPGVYKMRLAQDQLAGVAGGDAVAVPTYDLGCPFGVRTDACPFGSVHNLDKAPIGARVARQLWRIMSARRAAVSAPSLFPRAVSATYSNGATKAVVVTVQFNVGAPPLTMSPTQHCADCCSAGVGDFDVSFDGGASFVNATTVPTILGDGTSLAVPVLSPEQQAAPTHVRYTANQAFPQCAVVDAQRLPAFPFVLPVVALRRP